MASIGEKTGRVLETGTTGVVAGRRVELFEGAGALWVVDRSRARIARLPAGSSASDAIGAPWEDFRRAVTAADGSLVVELSRSRLLRIAPRSGLVP